MFEAGAATARPEPLTLGLARSYATLGKREQALYVLRLLASESGGSRPLFEALAEQAEGCRSLRRGAGARRDCAECPACQKGQQRRRAPRRANARGCAGRARQADRLARGQCAERPKSPARALLGCESQPNALNCLPRGGSSGDKARFARLPYVAFFLSGASSLIFQALLDAHAASHLGATSVAMSSVLTASWPGSAWAPTVRRRVARFLRPLRVYAACELGVALCALIIPLLVQSDGPVAGINAGCARASARASSDSCWPASSACCRCC